MVGQPQVLFMCMQGLKAVQRAGDRLVAGKVLQQYDNVEKHDHWQCALSMKHLELWWNTQGRIVVPFIHVADMNYASAGRMPIDATCRAATALTGLKLAPDHGYSTACRCIDAGTATEPPRRTNLARPGVHVKTSMGLSCISRNEGQPSSAP